MSSQSKPELNPGENQVPENRISSEKFAEKLIKQVFADAKAFATQGELSTYGNDEDDIEKTWINGGVYRGSKFEVTYSEAGEYVFIEKLRERTPPETDDEDKEFLETFYTIGDDGADATDLIISFSEFENGWVPSPLDPDSDDGREVNLEEWSHLKEVFANIEPFAQEAA